MTYEEAKRIINSDFVNYDEMQEARKVASECIDKQIPKKPNGYGIWCPVCDNFSIIDGEYGDHYNYCYECGQKLDWSDV